VLRQLAPYILPGRSSNAIFRSGTLRGRLARGVFRIQRLSLEGTYGQLFIDGTVSLQGRLNLDVLATTTNLGPSTPALRLLGLRVPAVGPLPLSLALEARNYLSNRLIHLRVTGTTRSPTITIEPLSLLTEEALLYFLNRANVPLP
jgi:translocation and assembly module TamB